MKKSKNIVLIVTPVLSAALLNACGSSRQQPYSVVNTTPATTPNQVTTAPPTQTAQTRDVYNNLDECVKDWLDKELCEQMSEDDDRDYRTRYKTNRTGRYFYGPGYSSADRIIVYKGKTITPTGKVTTKMPTFTSSVPSSKTTTSTTSTTSTTRSSTLPSTSSTSKSTTSSSSSSSTSDSTTTNPYSSSSSSRTSPYSSSSSSSTSPYSSSSSTTRGGFGSTSSSSSSRSFSSGS